MQPGLPSFASGDVVNSIVIVSITHCQHHSCQHNSCDSWHSDGLQITQSLVEDDEDAQELCYNVVERSLVNMQLQRRCHPTFLEDYSMYTQLLSLRRALQQPEDKESNTETSELAPGEVL